MDPLTSAKAADSAQQQVRSKRTHSQQQTRQNASVPIQHQLSMSSIQSPMQPGGTFNQFGGAVGQIGASLEEEDVHREPKAFGNPPAMMPQQEFPMFENASSAMLDAPYFETLKHVQDKIVSAYPSFPLQSHQDFFVSLISTADPVLWPR